MKTTDGRDKDIQDKQGVKTDFKYREESLKDAPTPSNNIKGSQQTLFLREDENKQEAKITVQTTEEAMATNKERTPVRVWSISSELKQQRRRWLRKRHIVKREFDLLQTLSYLFQPNSNFNSSDVGKLDCIEV